MPHTQGKLQVNDDGLPKIYINSEEGFRVAAVHWGNKHGNVWMERDEAEANAAHLVRCWNSHEELVEALKSVEWGGHNRACPWCKRTFQRGHNPDCKRQQALWNAGAR